MIASEQGEGVPKPRSILVISDDVAVACVLKCKEHGTSRRSCGLETLPDVVIDRQAVDY